MPPMTLVLADAAENLYPARMQMALSLGWHIVFACFGVGLPGDRAVRRVARPPHRRPGATRLLARRWAKAMGVLFAVGAVSGTHPVVRDGHPVAGADEHASARSSACRSRSRASRSSSRRSSSASTCSAGTGCRRGRTCSPGSRSIVAGVAGAFFVVAANAWMNDPDRLRRSTPDGNVDRRRPVGGDVQPVHAPPQTVHMILAAFMVAGFGVASVYAVGMLRGRRDRYHRLGLLIPLTVAVVVAPIQIGVGDWIANVVAEHSRPSSPRWRALYQTGTAVPLSLGGIYDRRRAARSPSRSRTGCRCWSHHDPNARGARAWTRSRRTDRPPVNVVHLAFNVMVGIGSALLAAGAWLGLRVVAPARPAREPAWFLRRGRGVRGSRAVRRAGGRLDHHRGRPPAVDRLRHPCAPPTRSARRRGSASASTLSSSSTPC